MQKLYEIQQINKILDKELRLQIKKIEKDDYMLLNKYIKNKELIKNLNIKKLRKTEQVIKFGKNSNLKKE